MQSIQHPDQRANLMFLRIVPNLAVLWLISSLAISGLAHARPHILLDAKSGTVLSHKQAFDRWHPASLTKMMTAYVAFDAIKAGEITMGSPVRVSKYALSKPPSKMGFPVGTILNFENALKIILVKSANDISVAIAESLSGSEQKFAQRMNETAHKLGMNSTNFINPHGLHHPLQYTNARDLGLLARALYRDYPQYSHMLKIPAIRFGKKRLNSYNKLLGRFEGTDGIKTGYVCASGFNIAASASRSDRRIIAIVLGASSSHQRSIRTAKLLTAGFEGSTGKTAGSIDQLTPYGTSRYVATNIRDEICGRKRRAKKETKKQRKARWKAEAVKRNAENLLYFSVRKSVQPVVVVLGSAFGPSPTGIKTLDGQKPPPYVPVPTKRPDFQLARIDDLPPFAKTTLRGSIPLPKFRSLVLDE
jgi:D-alanyl-D-alanine carboxypeptidase